MNTGTQRSTNKNAFAYFVIIIIGRPSRPTGLPDEFSENAIAIFELLCDKTNRIGVGQVEARKMLSTAATGKCPWCTALRGGVTYNCDKKHATSTTCGQNGEKHGSPLLRDWH
jgi:hypothetical protein